MHSIRIPPRIDLSYIYKLHVYRNTLKGGGVAQWLGGWRSGAVVRASDFGPRGPGFEPRPVHISLWP